MTKEFNDYIIEREYYEYKHIRVKGLLDQICTHFSTDSVKYIELSYREYYKDYYILYVECTVDGEDKSFWFDTHFIRNLKLEELLNDKI